MKYGAPQGKIISAHFCLPISKRFSSVYAMPRETEIQIHKTFQTATFDSSKPDIWQECENSLLFWTNWLYLIISLDRNVWSVQGKTHSCNSCKLPTATCFVYSLGLGGGVETFPFCVTISSTYPGESVGHIFSESYDQQLSVLFEVIFSKSFQRKSSCFHRAFNESHLAYHLRECFCVWHPQISCFPSIVKSTIARRQCFCPLFGIEFGQKKIKCTFCVGSPSFFSDVCHTGVDYVSVQALQWRKPTDFNIGQVLDPAQHVLAPPMQTAA